MAANQEPLHPLAPRFATGAVRAARFPQITTAPSQPSMSRSSAAIDPRTRPEGLGLPSHQLRAQIASVRAERDEASVRDRAHEAGIHQNPCHAKLAKGHAL